ncbi:hypothetical protein Btru_022974 [Bulinus truncatus]|nr:hypothetical protein Btru_022974 [Bulinus truncatus]
MTRIHEHLDAKIFFNQVRPFLAGWGREGNPMPDGLVYEGVSATPIKILGGSATQSLTLQALDCLLGVDHVTGHKGFIVKMRSFMAPDHKRFIEYLENRKYSLRQLVQSAETDILLSSYNNCLSALIQLRTYHIQIVSKYVVVGSKEINEGNYKSIDNKGTSGTSLILFLKDMRKDTEGKILSSQQLKKHSMFSMMSWLAMGAFAVVGSCVIISGVTFLRTFKT